MAVNKIKHEEVEAKIILSDIGMINETDVSLAKASNALLLGFNVKPNREAKKLAEEQNIEIKYFNKIIKPTDDELNAAYIQWKNAEEYKENRVVGTATTSGYDLVTNQLDQLYHDMKDGKLGVAATTGSWYVGITSVKTAFPKPS